jgi:acyl-CoA synthetase (AMP-forming)/AMP-acid ligase II
MLQDNDSHWVPAPGEEPELRTDLTVADLLDRAVAEHGEAEALVYAGIDGEQPSRLTYDELAERVFETAAALIGSGLGPGSKALIFSTNLVQFPILQLACAYADIVLVPVNPLYRRHELEHVLGLVKPEAAFVQPRHRGDDLAAVFEQAAAAVHRPGLSVYLDGPPNFETSDWDEWLATCQVPSPAAAVAARRAAVSGESLSQIQFTSGTTGTPKGVQLPNWILANQGVQLAARAGLTSADRYVNPMPMFHCGGCVVGTLNVLAAAACQHLIVTFDPQAICAAIEEEEATALAGVPTMLVAIDEERRRGDRRLDSLRIVVTGGSPVPRALGEDWKARLGIDLIITYGQTEFGPLSCVTSPSDPTDLQLGTVGRPMPHVELDVVGPGTDNRVPIGVEGELRYRGYVMPGYYRDPVGTEKAISADGWLRSGDLGRIDEQGYVRVTGRAKEMVIRGGENISPAAVEDAVRTLPEVADVCVIGLTDERMGEELCAVVRLEPDATLTVISMREALLPLIARFMVPRFLAVVDEFPLTPSGKIQRFKLAEELGSDRARVEDSLGSAAR